MALFLLVILVAVVFGILGVIVQGLLWLLAIGCILFAITLVYAATRLGHQNRAHTRH